MPTVNDAARVTTRDNAIWRTCPACHRLAALPPQVDRCPSCATGAAEPTSVRFTAAELEHARATLGDACSSARTRAERIEAACAFLTGYLGSAVTAAVAGDPYAASSLRR